MKKRSLKLLVIFSLGFTSLIHGQETIVKGIVQNWITDTAYICELPFHSPYSYSLQHQLIDEHGTFNFVFPDKDKPFVFFICPKKKMVCNQVKTLLFDNLTDQHYYGHCEKVYVNGLSTFLIEPGKTLEIKLIYNSWIEQLTPEEAERLKRLGVEVAGDNTVRDFGRTEIEFFGTERFQYEYYQKSFILDDKIDKALEALSSKNLYMAINKLTSIKNGLLADLDNNRNHLSPFFYDYIKAEIEFGTKKEFLKYLRFEKEELLYTIMSNGDIPKEFFEVIAFDTYQVDDATLLSEEYNEYVENYINFIMSMVKGEYVKYYPFNMEKLQFVSEELPMNNFYNYTANHLLHNNITEENSVIAESLIRQFPKGELNHELQSKFKLD